MIFGIVLVLGGTFGAAAGVSYFVRLVEKTPQANKEKMLSAINNIHGVSTLKYSNGENISDISSDLIRVNVPNNAISENVKNALIATEDDTFKTNDGVVPKAVIRGIIGSVELESSPAWQSISSQTILSATSESLATRTIICLKKACSNM